MAITKIKVENLTVFENMEMDIDANVNVIIGENGTGKTHLLKFIYLACFGPMVFFPQEEQQEMRETSAKTTRRFPFAERFFGKGINLSRDNITDSTFQLFSGESIGAGYSLRLQQSRVYDFSFLREVFGPFDQGMKLNEIREKMVFLPAKDMLTHSKGFLSLIRERGKQMPFDDTLINVISKAGLPNLNETPELAKDILPKLEKEMDGIVVFENDEFFILKNDDQMLPFSVEAEGIKKIGLLWKLLMTGSITEGSILLWDEPEANINPKLIPLLADIILELGRNGVQIFLATHDYFLPEYIEALKEESDKVAFHSLYHTDNGVKCETKSAFSMLTHNTIIDEKIRLYREATEKVLGWEHM